MLAHLVYALGFRYFQRELVGAFILSLGIVLFLDGTLLAVFGGATSPVPEIFPGTLTIFDVPIAIQRVVLCFAALLVTLVLYWLLARTQLGRALRAIAIDHEAAMLQGIPYDRIAFIGFMIAAALAAIAGALIAPIAVVSPVLGADYILKGFMAIIIGGLGSVPGAVVGSVFIAAIEAVGGFYFDSSTASMAIFVLAILVLLVKPRGLLVHG
jgi:branched-chain amino acid transport system permease protein